MIQIYRYLITQCKSKTKMKRKKTKERKKENMQGAAVSWAGRFLAKSWQGGGGGCCNFVSSH